MITVVQTWDVNANTWFPSLERLSNLINISAKAGPYTYASNHNFHACKDTKKLRYDNTNTHLIWLSMDSSSHFLCYGADNSLIISFSSVIMSTAKFFSKVTWISAFLQGQAYGFTENLHTYR